MIAQRFASLGYAGAVAASATALYLVSLQVAAERGRVEAVERQIVLAKRDIVRLNTELGARASLRQLEKWNGEVLALAPPVARQVIHRQIELAALDASQLSDIVPAVPAIGARVMTASATAPAAPPVAKVVTVAATRPASAPARPVAADRAPDAPARLHRAADADAADRARPRRLLLASATLDDIGNAARSEGQQAKRAAR